MPPTTIKTLLFALAVLVAGCSLTPFPPLVTVTVRADMPMAQRAARGPALADMACYAVIVGGGPNAVTSGQLGDRDPSCLRVNGTFHGPLSYSQITSGSGVQITLPVGTYNFSVVGFDKVGGCPDSLSAFYSSGTSVQTFPVVTPKSANLAETTQLSLPSTEYSLATTDLTPLCPPQAFSCDGTTACDRFSSPDYTTIEFHTMDVGGSWNIDSLGNAIIFENSFQIAPNAPTITGHASTLAGVTDLRVKGKLWLGAADYTIVGLEARRTDSQNYAFARISRNSVPFSCVLELGERLSNADTVYQSLALPPGDCLQNEYMPLVFELVGGLYTVTYKGYFLSQGGIVSGLNGLFAGVNSHYSGMYINGPRLDDFSTVPMARHEFWSLAPILAPR